MHLRNRKNRYVVVHSFGWNCLLWTRIMYIHQTKVAFRRPICTVSSDLLYLLVEKNFILIMCNIPNKQFFLENLLHFILFKHLAFHIFIRSVLVFSYYFNVTKISI